MENIEYFKWKSVESLEVKYVPIYKIVPRRFI